MENYYNMLNGIIDTCNSIEDVLITSKAPLWPASTYVTFMHARRLAAGVKVADGAEKIEEAANLIGQDAITLKACYKRNRVEERNDENLEQLYATLHKQAWELMCYAIDERYREYMAKLDN